MKKFHSSETMWLITVVLAILFAANTLLGVMLTSQSSASMKDLLQTRMLDVANTAADMLDGDKLKALQAQDKGTPDYQKVNDTLAYFRDNVELAYIYCIQPKGEREFVFSVDPTLTDPGEFGSPIVYTEALYQASQGKAAVDNEAYSDAWGRFYSAYSPVFGSDGKVAGIVAVDFNAKWYEEQMARQTHTIYICMAISSGLCVVMFLLATRRLRRRIRDMTNDLSTLAKDLDGITWEMGDLASAQAISEESANLTNLNEKLQAVKDNLHRYWTDARAKVNIITASLASDYRDVYYLNLDTGTGICYQSLSDDVSLKAEQEFPFMEVMERYANAYVVEADREAFLKFIQPGEIRKALKKNVLLTHYYKIRREEVVFYAMARIAAIKHPDNQSGFGIRAVGIGFADVDWQMSQALDRRQPPAQ